jgi:hypothetical protein
VNVAPGSIASSSHKRRTRLILCGLLSVCCAALFWAPPASAHVLKVDGTISAILHVDPNDEPVSGVPTTYILFMDDSTGKFSLSDCDCTVSMIEDGQTIAIQSLSANSQGIIDGSIVFPKPDVYDLVFSGNPTAANAFQPFTLDYLERATQGPTNDALSWSSAILLGVCAVAASGSLVACWLHIKYNSHERERT